MLSSDETRAGGKPNPRKEKRAQNRDKARAAKTRSRCAGYRNRISRRAAGQAELPRTDRNTRRCDRDRRTASRSPTLRPSFRPAEESAPVSYRAIADAWGNYSRTSLEQTRSYFEKLAGVRSLGAAFEVQAEFAKQACDTFVAQSQRIGELQGELARQRMKRLEGFMEKMTRARGGRERLVRRLRLSSLVQLHGSAAFEATWMPGTRPGMTTFESVTIPTLRKQFSPPHHTA